LQHISDELFQKLQLEGLEPGSSHEKAQLFVQLMDHQDQALL
jgi:hypothetical protein